MCLILQSSDPRTEASTTSHDIICYKVVIKFNNKHPFGKNRFGKRCGYDFRGTYHVSYIYERHNVEPRFSETVCGSMVHHGFHSFMRLDDVLREYKSWANIVYGSSENTPCIMECLIPAGTPYYVGNTDEGRGCYCSKEIIFNREIKFEPV